jgi:hypothetical protein
MSSNNLPFRGDYALTVDTSTRGVTGQVYVGTLEVADTGSSLFFKPSNREPRFPVDATISHGMGIVLTQRSGLSPTLCISKIEGARAMWTFEVVHHGSKSHQILMNPKLEAALNWILEEIS